MTAGLLGAFVLMLALPGVSALASASDDGGEAPASASNCTAPSPVKVCAKVCVGSNSVDVNGYKVSTPGKCWVVTVY